MNPNPFRSFATIVYRVCIMYMFLLLSSYDISTYIPNYAAPPFACCSAAMYSNQAP